MRSLIFFIIIFVNFQSIGYTSKIDLKNKIKIEYLKNDSDSIIFMVKNKGDSLLIYNVFVLTILNDTVKKFDIDPFRNLDSEPLKQYFELNSNSSVIHRIGKKNRFREDTFSLYLYLCKAQYITKLFSFPLDSALQRPDSSFKKYFTFNDYFKDPYCLYLKRF